MASACLLPFELSNELSRLAEHIASAKEWRSDARSALLSLCTNQREDREQLDYFEDKSSSSSKKRSRDGDDGHGGKEEGGDRKIQQRITGLTTDKHREQQQAEEVRDQDDNDDYDDDDDEGFKQEIAAVDRLRKLQSAANLIPIGSPEEAFIDVFLDVYEWCQHADELVGDKAQGGSKFGWSSSQRTGLRRSARGAPNRSLSDLKEMVLAGEQKRSKLEEWGVDSESSTWLSTTDEEEGHGKDRNSQHKDDDYGNERSMYLKMWVVRGGWVGGDGVSFMHPAISYHSHLTM